MHPYDVMLQFVGSYFLVNAFPPYVSNVGPKGAYLLSVYLEGSFFTDSLFDSPDDFDVSSLIDFLHCFNDLYSSGFLYPCTFSTN